MTEDSLLDLAFLEELGPDSGEFDPDKTAEYTEAEIEAILAWAEHEAERDSRKGAA